MFLTDEMPDILCLQETKVVDGDFPEGVFRRLGYNHLVLCGQRMHHGVAILSRLPIREDHRHDWQDNGEARHVGVQLDCGIRLENVCARWRRHSRPGPESEIRSEARLYRADDALVGKVWLPHFAGWRFQRRAAGMRRLAPQATDQCRSEEH